MLFIKYCFSDSKSGFFFYFSKKLGRSGDGEKKNILLGWLYNHQIAVVQFPKLFCRI